jgi:putative sterol carrier protein
VISGSETLENHIAIKDQSCRLIQGRAENPTLTIDSPSDIWLKVCTGQMDPKAAYFEGKYKVDGDMELLMKMGVLFG